MEKRQTTVIDRCTVEVIAFALAHPRLYPQVRLRMAHIMETTPGPMTLKRAFKLAVEQQRAERRAVKQRIRQLARGR